MGSKLHHGVGCLKKGGTGTLLRTMMIFDSILSNIDEVLLINPSSNVFVFGAHHKDWVTYSGGTD